MFDFIDRWLDEWRQRKEEEFERRVRWIVYKMQHENDPPSESVSISPSVSPEFFTHYYYDENGRLVSYSPSPSPELKE